MTITRQELWAHGYAPGPPDDIEAYLADVQIVSRMKCPKCGNGLSLESWQSRSPENAGISYAVTACARCGHRKEF